MRINLLRFLKNIRVQFGKFGRLFPKFPFRKILGYLVAIIFFFAALAAIFPEPFHSVAYNLYEKLSWDKPELIFENLSVFTEDKPFSGCDPGYYLSTNDYSLSNFTFDTNQSFINFSPLHDLTFTIRNVNELSNSPSAIKKVLVDFRGFYDEKLFPFYATGECGGGAQQKIYFIDPKNLSDVINSKVNKTIEAEIWPNKKQDFDFVILTKENSSEEYFRLLIPLSEYGVLKFRLILFVEHKGKTFKFTSKDYFIGNSEAASEYWKKESKIWYAKEGFDSLLNNFK